MTSAPNVVIAGERGADRSILVRALLGGEGVSMASRDAAPGAFVVYRRGDRPGVRAFIPGFREPRAVAFGDEPGEYPVPAFLGAAARPPRRIEVAHGSALLRHCTLVDAPVVARVAEMFGEVIAHAAGDDGALLYVTDGARPMDPAEINLLWRVARRTTPVLFVVAGLPDGRSMSDRQGALAARVPPLASAPWFRLDREAGVPAVRRSLIELAAGGSRSPVVDLPRRESVRVESAPWRVVLDRGMGRCRQEVLHWLAAELAVIQERRQSQIADGPAVDTLGGTLDGSGRWGDAAVREMPAQLDHELHTLSVRLTDRLDAVCRGVTDRVMRAAFGRRPTADLVRHVAADLWAMDAAVPEEALLVTSTAGVTALCGDGALAGLSADPAATRRSIVRPFGVALSAGCFLLWENHANVSRADARVWLGRALDSVAASLLTGVVARCHEVHELLAEVFTGPHLRQLAS
jgi:hypothetical protein